MRLPSLEILNKVYGESEASLKRYEDLLQQFKEHFNSEQMEFFSAPGRTEIVGNHTDHNGGKILAASITLDTIGAAYPNNSNIISIFSEGYENEIRLDLTKIDEVPINQGTLSLIAGMMKATTNAGFKAAGFNAYISTSVISAAGVSSSASFEMLICSIINYFFNDSKMSYIDYAKIGQYAENKYWSKASGLMDQMACAVGGTISLDFSNDVKYEKVDFSFSKIGYDLIIVNTGKGHADLSHEYSEIPMEMKAVANKLGGTLLCDSNLQNFLEHFTELEESLENDRALLRSMHFYEENRRVEEAIQAVADHNEKHLLKIIEESGNSSWKWLQNCYVATDNKDQKINLALALTEIFIKKIGDGSCRIHGGGFAGVIMSIIPKAETSNYIEYMSKFIDEKSIYPMNIREYGAIHLG
ncbi:MAG TPA: galactokinase [Lachnoclostridium phytofermentans]|uniref:Galactokinase n=1 Tax=Lachnoclostridium phytofermentans TaxID=66219 RepID=A0A3D2X6X6_9FIRM|nr:galactokinase family protein [Lachnoclostridium sp.]HCL02890.1 galactokinase [Lachnoclostridium phytofermentans]